MQAFRDIVDNYFITVDTMPMLCQANVPTMESTVSGESRFFIVNGVEEFSTISITVTASNNGGVDSATIMITTSRAGTYATAMVSSRGGGGGGGVFISSDHNCLKLKGML